MSSLRDAVRRSELNFSRTPCFYLLPVAHVERATGHSAMDEERLIYLVERSYLVVCLHDVTEVHI